MALTVPNAKNYESPLNAVPLDWLSAPKEGPKGIQCSITWSDAQSGINRAVYINLQNNATLNFSKVRALVFDNSLNGSDVQVIFPDTETTVSIPAYTPYAVVNVFTNQTQFYIVSPNALASDVTNFMVMNTLPPPLAVPTTQEQNFAASGLLDTTLSGFQNVVPRGVNGTLEAAQIGGFIQATAGNGASTLIWLVDGSTPAKTFFYGTMASFNALMASVPNIIEQDDLRLRFSNGLDLNWNTSVGTVQTSKVTCNLFYRTP